jgi:hemerythrin
MATNFNMLPWAPAWEIGVSEIDDDHRRLIDQCNALFKALAEARHKAEIMTIIRRMESESWEHFRREETILREVQYEEVDEHAAEHRRIERELEKAIGAIETAEASVAEWQTFALSFQSTLVNHLLLYDLKYKSHLLWKRGR